MNDKARELADWHSKREAECLEAIAKCKDRFSVPLALQAEYLFHGEAATALRDAADREDKVRGVVELVRLAGAHEVSPKFRDMILDALTPQTEPVASVAAEPPPSAVGGIAAFRTARDMVLPEVARFDAVARTMFPSAVAGGVENDGYGLRGAFREGYTMCKFAGYLNEQNAWENSQTAKAPAAQPEGAVAFDLVYDDGSLCGHYRTRDEAEYEIAERPTNANPVRIVPLYTRPAEVTEEMVDEARAAYRRELNRPGKMRPDSVAETDAWRAALAALVKPV